MKHLHSLLKQTLALPQDRRTSRISTGASASGASKQSKASGSRKKKPIRALLVMRNRQCYLHCLKQLQLLGVRPIKKLHSLHAVLYHIRADSDLRELRRHTMVRRVETDIRAKLHVRPVVSGEANADSCASNDPPQVVPWGIRAIGARTAWKRTQGGGVKVAVLDTGVAAHPDLKITGGFNTITGKSYKDDNGHGTHVAGTIAAIDNKFGVVGAAPKARIYAVKAFDSSGSAYNSDIIQGIDWCIRHGIRVINMSFGMSAFSGTLRDVIRRAYKRGIVMVASAGNDGPSNLQIDYPARFPETIAVAASQTNGSIADFSSRGTGIDVAAPGVGVCSTYPGSRYLKLDGTSMASPHVTGTVALLRARMPGIGTASVRTLLKRTAKPLTGTPTRQQGSGLVQASRAVAALSASAVRVSASRRRCLYRRGRSSR